MGISAKRVLGTGCHVPQPSSSSIMARWHVARSSCRARANSVFLGHVVGANGTVAHERSKGSPLITTCCGGIYILNFYSTHHFFSPTSPKWYSCMTIGDRPRSRKKYISTSPSNSPNSPRAENPAVASSRDRFIRETIRDERQNIQNQTS